MERRSKAMAIVAGVLHLELMPAEATSGVKVTTIRDDMTHSLFLNFTVVPEGEEDVGDASGLKLRSSPLALPAVRLSGLSLSGCQLRALAGRAAWTASMLAGAAACEALRSRRVTLPFGMPWRHSDSELSVQLTPELTEAAAQEEWSPEEPKVEEEGPCQKLARFLRASNALPWLTAAAGISRIVWRRSGNSAVRPAKGYTVKCVPQAPKPWEGSLSEEELTPTRNSEPFGQNDEMEVDLKDTPPDNKVVRKSVRGRGSGMVRQRTTEIEEKIEFFRIMTDDTSASADDDAMTKQASIRRSNSLKNPCYDAPGEFAHLRFDPYKRQTTDDNPLAHEFEALSRDLRKTDGMFFRMDTAE